MSERYARILEALRKQDWRTIYTRWYELPGDMRARLTRLLMTAMEMLPEDLRKEVPAFAKRLYEELKKR